MIGAEAQEALLPVVQRPGQATLVGERRRFSRCEGTALGGARLRGGHVVENFVRTVVPARESRLESGVAGGVGCH